VSTTAVQITTASNAHESAARNDTMPEAAWSAAVRNKIDRR
jgi:hypothetical protein